MENGLWMFIIFAAKTMQQKVKRDVNKMINFRRVKTKFNHQSMHQQDLGYTKGHSLRVRVYTECQYTPEKTKKRVVTQEKAPEMTIRNSTFRVSQQHFRREELKDHMYLIHLCKNLQTAAFKYRNPTIDVLGYQQLKSTAPPTLKEEARIRKVLPTVEKIGISAARQDRKTLKQRMKILEKTISGFQSQY